MTADISFATFESRVGEVFGFTWEGAAIELTLTEVESSGATPAGRPAGAVRFDGPREPVLPQATYDVTHPELGEFPLFVVPVGQTAEVTNYEAVFG